MTTSINNLARLDKSFLEKDNSSAVQLNTDEPCPTIVHLGVGAFHRAHQAWYTQNTNLLSNNQKWKIIGVSLRSATMAEQLNPQDGVYAVVEQSAEGYAHQLIDVIDHVLVAPQLPSAVLAALCDDNTQIVSLTITEKGYCHDPSSGQLNLQHPDIQHDLENASCPRSALGYLVWAIHTRWQQNKSPLTLMSCDNLPANGELLRGLVLAFAQQIDSTFAEHINAHYCFPSSMVDRIVPAMTDKVRLSFCEKLGFDDHGLIVTETFSQWVIEDNFAQSRPAWETAGALLVQDVHAFETMKLRLLNGSHSSIAYVGYLSGFSTVADTINDPMCQTFIKGIMQEELLPSVNVPDGIDLQRYCEQLLERFANPHLHHQTYQIAMDGSQKLPQRLLQALAFQLAENKSIERICFVLAAWMQYTSGYTLQGKEISVQDPFSLELASAYQCANGDIGEWVDEVLSMDSIFDQDLRQHPQVSQTICRYLTHIRQQQRACDSLQSLNMAVSQ